MFKRRLTRGAASALPALPILFWLAAVSSSQPGGAGTGPWSGHPMWGWGVWGLGMGIMMLIFWAAIIVGIVALVRWLRLQGHGASSSGAGGESPLDIAKRRYAAGEIAQEEFETLKRNLS